MSSFDSEMTDDNHGTSENRFHTDITNNRLAENSGLRAAENEVIRIITKVSFKNSCRSGIYGTRIVNFTNFTTNFVLTILFFRAFLEILEKKTF